MRPEQRAEELAKVSVFERTGVTSVRIKRTPINVLDVIFDVKNDTATVITTCPACNLPNKIENIPADPLVLWLQHNGHIQDRLPMLDDNQREGLISGMHGECWDKMFADEEDEGDEDRDDEMMFGDQTALDEDPNYPRDIPRDELDYPWNQPGGGYGS